MLLAGPHETSDRHHRCLHHPQQPVARKEGGIAKQKRHGTCYLVIVVELRQILSLLTTVS